MNDITLIDLIVKLEEYNKEAIVSNDYFYTYNLHNWLKRQSGEYYISPLLNVIYILQNKDRVRIVTDDLSYGP